MMQVRRIANSLIFSRVKSNGLLFSAHDQNETMLEISHLKEKFTSQAHIH